MELISIIMAAYNAEKTIRESIDSVLSQTYRNFELIVVNDGSSDHTAEIVSSYLSRDHRIQLIDLPVNGGVSEARLTAAQAAQGQWICILDSDDVWTSDKLEKQIHLQRQTDAQFLFTGSGFMDANGQALQGQLHVPAEITYQKLLDQNLISNSSVMLLRELYLTHYAKGDQMHEDFATWLNILKTGITAYGLDEPLLMYRLSPVSRSGNKFHAAKMNWHTYRYIGLSPLSALGHIFFISQMD